MATQQSELLIVDFKPADKRFKSPTIEEVRLHAIDKQLPPIEAEKFWHYYEMVGWKVGGKKTMTSWHAAMAGWKLRWQERLDYSKPRTINDTVHDDRMVQVKKVLTQLNFIETTRHEPSRQMPILWKSADAPNQ